MRIQIASDIHTEYRTSETPLQVAAPTLLLLGDIGNPFSKSFEKFIQTQINRFEEVYFVAGNHEFYGNHIGKTIDKLYSFDDHWSNFHFFDRRKMFIDNFVFLGCTLWTHIERAHADEILHRLNDFNEIHIDHSKKLNLMEYELMHIKDRNWLQNEINVSRKNQMKTIVMTHHSPIIRSGNPIYHGSPLTSAFANPFEAMLCDPVRLWTFGHTHWPIDVVYNRSTRVFANQLGYEGENIPDFKGASSIHLDDTLSCLI